MKAKVYCVVALLIAAGANAWADDKPATAADPGAAGKALVIKNKCSICHAVDGKGGKLGKPMAAFAELSAEKITEGILDPKKALGPTTKMPSYKGKLTDDEVKQVVVYIQSLKPVPVP